MPLRRVRGFVVLQPLEIRLKVGIRPPRLLPFVVFTRVAGKYTMPLIEEQPPSTRPRGTGSSRSSTWRCGTVW